MASIPSDTTSASKHSSSQVPVDACDKKNDPKDDPKVNYKPGTPEIREPSVSEKSTPVSPMDNAFFPGPEKWWYQKESESKTKPSSFYLSLEPESWWGCRRHSETDIIGIPPNIDRRRSLTPELSCSKPICHTSKQTESGNENGTLTNVDESVKSPDNENSSIENEKTSADGNREIDQETKNRDVPELGGKQDSNVEIEEDSKQDYKDAEHKIPLVLELSSPLQAEHLTPDDLVLSVLPNVTEDNLESEISEDEVFATDEHIDSHQPTDITTVSIDAPIIAGVPSESIEQIQRVEPEQSANDSEQTSLSIGSEPKPEADTYKDDIHQSENISESDVKNADHYQHLDLSNEPTDPKDITEQIDLSAVKGKDQEVLPVAPDSQDLDQPLVSEQTEQTQTSKGAANIVTDTKNEQKCNQQQEDLRHIFSNIPVISYTPSESLVGESSPEPVHVKDSVEVQPSKSHLEQTQKIPNIRNRQGSKQTSRSTKLSRKLGKRQLEEIPIGVRRTDVGQGDPKTKSNSFNIFISFAVISLLLAYLAISSFLSVTYSYFSHHTEVSKSPRQVELAERMKQLEESFPNQSPLLWNTVSSHLKENPHLEGPIVLLLVGLPNSQSTTSCLASKLGDMFDAVFQSMGHPTVINGTLYQDYTADIAKVKIDKTLRSGVNKGSHCAVIHNIDHIPPCAALLFHEYCKNDDAPFKDVTIVQTIQLKPSDLIGGDLKTPMNYGKMVNNHLTQVWKSCAELTADTQDAMLSRIANNFAVVMEESESQLGKMCNL